MLDVDVASEAARTLRLEGMPEHEIQTVLRSRDPRVVRRIIALHTERLEERLLERRGELRRVERHLIESVCGR